MDFTPAYKPGGNIILLLLLIFFLPLSVSDKPTMSSLLAAMTPTPFGWSSTTHFCDWRGVTCDGKNRVTSLNLASLSLSGILPLSLNSLTYLTAISLEYNHFSGQIPSFANLSRLRHLHLHNNSFAAVYGHTFSGLIAIRTLSLSNNNNLSPWPFPSELASSPQLTALYASNTNMIGSIPNIFLSFPHLVNLTLSYNNLTGSLPASFKSLLSIQNLKLDNQKMGLTGNIDHLTGMNNLSVLWLQCNRFTGIIPTSFASLPNLIQVKLDSNKFTPPIPHFPIVAYKFLTNDTVSSNCLRCKLFIRMVVAPAPRLPPLFPEPTSEKKTNVGLVVGLTIILILMVFGFFFGVRWLGQRRRRRLTIVQQEVSSLKQIDFPIPMVVQKQPEKIARVERDGEEKERIHGQQPDRVKNAKRNPEKMEDLGPRPQKEEIPVMRRGKGGNNNQGKEPQQLVDEQGFYMKKYPYNYVRIMTNNFDSRNVIGEGGFARVYKGELLNGTSVAVKRLKQIHKRVDDYKNEVEALGQTSHFNLVKLIGYCAEDEHRMLVYEYMRNGPLQEWIFGTNPEKTLSWLEKKRIILGIAEGLLYLHENCSKKIMHRDLKPPNVLLDDKKNAKLCDFGISKLLERDQSSTSTVGCGTPGYVAPEIRKGIRKISEKVDVYSFGIVVLEVVFGKRYYRLVSSSQTDLEASQLPGLIRKLDDEMRKNGKEIERIGKLAISCLSDEPEARPTMSDIVVAIKGADAKVGRY